MLPVICEKVLRRGGDTYMKEKQILFGIILSIVFIGQVMNKSYLAVFPLIGAVAFFISAWRLKE